MATAIRKFSPTLSRAQPTTVPGGKQEARPAWAPSYGQAVSQSVRPRGDAVPGGKQNINPGRTPIRPPMAALNRQRGMQPTGVPGGGQNIRPPQDFGGRVSSIPLPPTPPPPPPPLVGGMAGLIPATNILNQQSPNYDVNNLGAYTEIMPGFGYYANGGGSFWEGRTDTNPGRMLGRAGPTGVPGQQSAPQCYRPPSYQPSPQQFSPAQGQYPMAGGSNYTQYPMNGGGQPARAPSTFQPTYAPPQGPRMTAGGGRTPAFTPSIGNVVQPNPYRAN